jgi:hypothetical protein
MAFRARRIAALERQVVELAAKLEQYHDQAAMVRAFEETCAAPYSRRPVPCRPRHLRAVPGGAR